MLGLPIDRHVCWCSVGGIKMFIPIRGDGRDEVIIGWRVLMYLQR
jgi:hypothetical protein